MKPVKAVVKSMTVSRNVTEVYNYFEIMKNLEVGGQITSCKSPTIMIGGRLTMQLQESQR
jgi:hypothetical protein